MKNEKLLTIWKTVITLFTLAAHLKSISIQKVGVCMRSFNNGFSTFNFNLVENIKESIGFNNTKGNESLINVYETYVPIDPNSKLTLCETTRFHFSRNLSNF